MGRSNGRPFLVIGRWIRSACTSCQRSVRAAYVAVRRVQPIKGAVQTDRITAPATINRELDVMRAAWRYAIKCGMDLPGIGWSIERLVEPETRERVATEGEEDGIFRHLRSDYAPFFAAIRETGWRCPYQKTPPTQSGETTSAAYSPPSACEPLTCH